MSEENILHKYFCTECSTWNHIHWFVKNGSSAPCCCECGQENFENYTYHGTVKIQEGK
mgnify:CR=1 FL=1